MNKHNQIIDGFSANMEACLYIFGIGLLFTFLQPTIDEKYSNIDKLKFIIENKLIYQTWILLIYFIFGIGLVCLDWIVND